MSEPIKPGDLVQVVAPSMCPAAPLNAGLGYTYTVDETYPSSMTGRACGYCGGEKHFPNAMGATDGHGAWYPFYRLKRIPPLDELDDVKQDEEITA